MHLEFIGRITTTGTNTVAGTLDAGFGAGVEVPYMESRNVVLVISPDAAYTGSNEKFQGSEDGGTTWTDLMTSTEINTISAGQVFMKEVSMPNQLRASASRTAGTISFYALGDV